MSTKKVLNHSAILSELKSNFGEKNKGRNFSNNANSSQVNNSYLTKVHTIDKTVNTIKTLKNSFMNDKTFYGTEMKDKIFPSNEKKVLKESSSNNNYQNNKIDIKISINNYGKEKKNENNVLFKPKVGLNNLSISKKNDSLESDSLLNSQANSSNNNNIMEKSRFKLTSGLTGSVSNKLQHGLNYQSKISGAGSTSNNSFAFNPKLRNNYTSNSHPPLKTEANDEKTAETSMNLYNNNEILQTEPITKDTFKENLLSVSQNNNFFKTATANKNDFNFTFNNGKLAAVESQLEQVLNRSLDKKSENLNEKLNIIKGCFDEVVKLSPNELNKVLSKIHTGYIDVVQKLISRLNSKTTDTDNLHSSKLVFTVEYSALSKKYEDQNDELRFLRSKMGEFQKASENSTNLPSHNNNNIVKVKEKENKESNNDFFENEHNEFISNMNKININDLEALYFVDKVQMRSNSVSENKQIPKLDFNIFNQSENANQMKNYEEYKKLQIKQQNKAFPDKQSVSPMKTFFKEPERYSLNKSQNKKLVMNNLNDTTLDKEKMVKISNYTTTTKNMNYNPFKK